MGKSSWTFQCCLGVLLLGLVSLPIARLRGHGSAFMAAASPATIELAQAEPEEEPEFFELGDKLMRIASDSPLLRKFQKSLDQLRHQQIDLVQSAETGDRQAVGDRAELYRQTLATVREDAGRLIERFGLDVGLRLLGDCALGMHEPETLLPTSLRDLVHDIDGL
jgi:hypothetical protein